MPRGGGGPCPGGAGGGLVRRGCACGCGSHASSCDGGRWAERCVSWGHSRGERVGRADRLRRGSLLVKGEIVSRKTRMCRETLPSGAAVSLLPFCQFLDDEKPLGRNGFCHISFQPGTAYGAICRSCRPLPPLHILAPAGWPEDTSPESDRSRPAGWTEGAAPRGGRFSTGVDRPVENCGEALGGLWWRRIPLLSGISFVAHCAGA
jgi:hypothetical protein